jgi:hypothetical protein
MADLPIFPKKNSSGQALLLVLLSMAVILTIVLSILSRSITDVAVTTRSEESLRAFSAAEAGVERALIAGSDIGSTELGDAEFSADVSSFGEGSQDISYPIKILSGESVNLWFVAHNADKEKVCTAEFPCFTGNTVKVCWGESGTGSSEDTTPAVEVSFFYASTPGDYSTTQIARAVYDPNATRRSTNNFAATDLGTCSAGGTTYEFQKTIDISSLGVPAGSYSVENGLQYAKVRMLYNSSTKHGVGFDVNFAGNSLLPAQGVNIASLGTSGEANRRIEVFRAYAEVPPIFDAAAFSSGGIVK